MRRSFSSAATPSRGKKIAKRVATVGLIGALGFGAVRGIDNLARIENPDFVGRQKFWTLSSKSMEVYHGKPIPANLMGSSKYRLGASLARAGLRVYDINVAGQKTGTLKANFKVVGSKYTIELNGIQEHLERPFQIYRKRWTLDRGGKKPNILINETSTSFWTPGVHYFELVDAKTGKVMGQLSAQWNLRRFLIGKRDYALKLEPGFEGNVSKGEVVGILTTIGKLAKKGSSSSSSKSSKKGK